MPVKENPTNYCKIPSALVVFVAVPKTTNHNLNNWIIAVDILIPRLDKPNPRRIYFHFPSSEIT